MWYSDIAYAIRMFYGPQSVHNVLNPVLLAVGSRGYLIQSRTLHIPDRYGYFSPGSPRLQVSQAFHLAFWTLILGIPLILELFNLLMSRIITTPVRRSIMRIYSMLFSVLAFTWVFRCYVQARS